MTVLFSGDLYAEKSSVSSLYGETEGLNVLNSGCVGTSIDVCHVWNAVQMLKDEGGHPWTKGHICVNLIMLGVGSPIIQAECIKLKMVVHTSAAFVR